MPYVNAMVADKDRPDDQLAGELKWETRQEMLELFTAAGEGWNPAQKQFTGFFDSSHVLDKLMAVITPETEDSANAASAALEALSLKRARLS